MSRDHEHWVGSVVNVWVQAVEPGMLQFLDLSQRGILVSLVLRHSSRLQTSTGIDSGLDYRLVAVQTPDLKLLEGDTIAVNFFLWLGIAIHLNLLQVVDYSNSEFKVI